MRVPSVYMSSMSKHHHSEIRHDRQGGIFISICFDSPLWNVTLEGTFKGLCHEIDSCGGLQNLISPVSIPYPLFMRVDGFKIFENCILQLCYSKLCSLSSHIQ